MKKVIPLAILILYLVLSNKIIGYSFYTLFTFVPIIIFSVANIALNLRYGKSNSIFQIVLSILAPLFISLLFIHEIYLVDLGYSGTMNLLGLFIFIITVPLYLIMETIVIVNIKN